MQQTTINVIFNENSLPIEDNMQDLKDQTNFKRLLQIFTEKTRRLVFICGSGASMEAGLPNWNDLITKIARHYLSSANTEIAEKLTEELSSKIKFAEDNWQRMSILKKFMGEGFEQAVKFNLTPEKDAIPTFYSTVWDLDPHALLTFNLDGFSNASYAEKKTGKAATHLFGIDAHQSRVALGNGRPLIADLHGQIDKPYTWILTKEQKESLLQNKGYIEFLKSMFTHNLVVFYGIDVDDLTVNGQLAYLSDLDFKTGDYFIVKREFQDKDLELSKKLPLNFIYTGKGTSWEDGFKNFVEALKKGKSSERPSYPVISHVKSENNIPSPTELISLSPDEIRIALSSATRKFYSNGEFDYGAYRNFCQEYDIAIHISTRVNPNDAAQSWLGNTINSELGKGNFGKVYQAFDKQGNSIAIKIAHMEVRDDEAMVNSFRRGVDSMRLLSESKIPGIVRLIDASELPPSIIMEYVEGIDLQKFINDNIVTDSITKLNIALWVAEIIFNCHSHEQIILHRDLRPSNIMVTGEYWESVSKENIKILDFDLSWFKGASGAEFYMNASQALGFLAPEQLDTRSRFSTRSALVDVYGIGMLLYFIMSKEIPLASASTRNDWPSRVKSASSGIYNKNWKSTKFLFEELVLSCTHEEQTFRPQLQDVIAKMQMLINIFDGDYPFTPDYVIIEMLCRLSPANSDISYMYNRRSGEHLTGAGISVFFSVNGNSIHCSIRYTMRESANRNTRSKTLNDALFRAKSKVDKFSKIDKEGTSTVTGANILKFSFETPGDLKTLNNIFSGVEFAVIEIAKEN